LAEPHHHLTVTGQRGTVRFDIALELRAPWTILFGPSGSGKSTILRAACGLTPSLHSQFHRNADDLTNTPPHQRRIAYAPQGAAIFPHLTVRENIAYPSRAQGTADPVLIDAAIELFLLGAMIHRMPRDLSGGERQRVALARAFAVPNAKLMLLDEPFTGIDRRMRDALLPRMIDRAASLNIPVVSVTHDVEEALLLEAEVIRLDSGRITARGPARDVLYEERTRMRSVLD
jgi:ABC-type Fe3+/spermidine/putrescine transport system ATPase subunit